MAAAEAMALCSLVMVSMLLMAGIPLPSADTYT